MVTKSQLNQRLQYIRVLAAITTFLGIVFFILNIALYGMIYAFMLWAVFLMFAFMGIFQLKPQQPICTLIKKLRNFANYMVSSTLIGGVWSLAILFEIAFTVGLNDLGIQALVNCGILFIFSLGYTVYILITLKKAKSSQASLLSEEQIYPSIEKNDYIPPPQYHP